MVFSWPINNNFGYFKRLFIATVIILPITLTISYGSITLKNDILKLILIGSSTALIITLLIILRQWLGWKYISKRLLSKFVEYEESGWYDGQVWEKPIDLQQKDLIIAQYEVQPIINIINSALLINTILITLIYSIYIYKISF